MTRTTMQRGAAIVGLIGVLAVGWAYEPTPRGRHGTYSDAPVWEYRTDVLPQNDTPAWKADAEGSPAVTATTTAIPTVGGYTTKSVLTVTCAKDERALFTLADAGLDNNYDAGGTTLEMGLAVSDTEGSAMLRLEDGAYQVNLYFQKTGIWTDDTSHIPQIAVGPARLFIVHIIVTYSSRKVR